MKKITLTFSLLAFSFSLSNAQIVTTLAGSTSIGINNGIGTAATFHTPAGIAYDGSGTLYIGDEINNRIRQIVISSANVTTLAGTGAQSDVNGPDSMATFDYPIGLSPDGKGNLFVADAYSYEVRKIGLGDVSNLAPSDLPTGVATDGSGNLYVVAQFGQKIQQINIASGAVTTLAGSGASGNANGIGTAATFNYPYGIAYDGSGNLYVGDQSNNEIRKIVISTGAVSLFAGSPTGATGSANGTGTAATFYGPEGLTCDGNGNLFVADYYNSEIRQIVISSGVVSLLAGSPTGGHGSADGTGTAANFYDPSGVATDGNGNLYVADMENNEIRQIVISSGVVTTFAGSPSIGIANGIGTAAQFHAPAGITCDGNGNLYVGDELNDRIRQIVISSANVTTLAGTGTQSGINGPDSAATFDYPIGVTTDGRGNLFVADAYSYEVRQISLNYVSNLAPCDLPTGAATDGNGNLYVVAQFGQKIQQINTASGAVTTLAGSGVSGNANGFGTAATFNYPYGVAYDGNGNLYVGDQSNNEIRKIVISSGQVSLVAGSPVGASGHADGIGTAASFYGPEGLACDHNGNLYVADYYNNEIRKIVLSSGMVYTYAGSTTRGTANGADTAARFNGPTGVAVDGSGNLYVADAQNNEIRMITPAPVAYFKASDTIFCNGGTVRFTDTSHNAPTSWQWYFQNGTPDTSTMQNPSVVFNSPGIDSVQLIINSVGGTSSLTKKTYIKVNGIITNGMIQSNTNICEGMPDTMVANVTGDIGCTVGSISYVWKPTGTPPTSGAEDTILVISNKAYTNKLGEVTMTDSNGCIAVDSIRINSSVIRTNGILTATQTTMCTGTYDTLVANIINDTISGSGSLSYSWLPLGGVGPSSGALDTDIVQMNKPWNGKLAIAYISGGGCRVIDSVKTIVNATPTVTITGIDTINAGSSDTLVAGGACNYIWPAGATTDTIFVFPTTATTYTLIGTCSGCSVTDTFTVHVNAPLGLNNLSNSMSISAYPNPSNGIFQILANSRQPIANSQIEVYTVLGEKVSTPFTIYHLPFTINLSAQPAGMYFVKVITGKDVQMVKIIKN
ncbi:MAG: T9SS type A sorting domain-containing protein [Bacteroidia bacterium]